MAAGSSPISVVGNTAPNCMAAILAARRRWRPPTWPTGARSCLGLLASGRVGGGGSGGGDGRFGGGIAGAGGSGRSGGASRSAQGGRGVAVPDEQGRRRADH